jgi:hypothetical protein
VVVILMGLGFGSWSFQMSKNERLVVAKVVAKEDDSKGRKKLEVLKQKQAVLQARIEQVAAREKTRERKQDLQRKILVGTFVLEEAEREGKVAELYQRMDGFLRRNSDRVLFGLIEVDGEKNKVGKKYKQ